MSSSAPRGRFDDDPIDVVVPADAQPGDLVGPWRVMLALVWVGVVFAFAAVWQASTQLGIATWWLGPRSAPTPPYLRLLPFAISIAVCVTIAYNLRRVLLVSATAAGLVAVGALFDLDRSIGLGLTELVIAAAAGSVTLAATTGRYRHAPLPRPAPSGPFAPPATDSDGTIDSEGTGGTVMSTGATGASHGPAGHDRG